MQPSTRNNKCRTQHKTVLPQKLQTQKISFALLNYAGRSVLGAQCKKTCKHTRAELALSYVFAIQQAESQQDNQLTVVHNAWVQIWDDENKMKLLTICWL